MDKSEKQKIKRSQMQKKYTVIIQFFEGSKIHKTELELGVQTQVWNTKEKQESNLKSQDSSYL